MPGCSEASIPCGGSQGSASTTFFTFLGLGSNFALLIGVGLVSRTAIMRAIFNLLLGCIVIALGVPAQGATYSGNGNSGFGGPIGLGSLTLTDNGTTVFGQV